MAKLFEVVLLDRDETATLTLPYQRLTITNARCLPSRNDTTIVILNRISAKLSIDTVKVCSDATKAP